VRETDWQSKRFYNPRAWLSSNERVARGYVRLRQWFEGAFAVIFAAASLKVLTSRLPT
jgi:threonine efflux protein